jgi:hypothetical protein
MNSYRCLFCGLENSGNNKIDYYIFECSCTIHQTHRSTFTITRELYDDLKDGDKKGNEHLVSGVIKELTLEQQEVSMRSENYNGYVNSTLIPQGLQEKENKVIRY